MRYYLYRLRKEDYEALDDEKNIKIDYIPGHINDDDKIIVFVSETLKIIGAYTKKDDFLILENPMKKDITLKEFYDKLSFITEVCPRTYKVFAKKAREISKEDYEKIEKRL